MKRIPFLTRDNGYQSHPKDGSGLACVHYKVVHSGLFGERGFAIPVMDLRFLNLGPSPRDEPLWIVGSLASQTKICGFTNLARQWGGGEASKQGWARPLALITSRERGFMVMKGCADHTRRNEERGSTRLPPREETLRRTPEKDRVENIHD